MKNIKKLKVLTTLVSALLLVGLSIYSASALVLGLLLNNSVETTRYTVTRNELISSGTFIGQDIIEYKVFTLGAGNQLLSFVTKVKQPFSVPNNTGLKISYIRAVQGANIVSMCNVAHSVDLTYINFERKGGEDCQEYGFYDLNNAVDIVIGVQTDDGSNISLLQQNGELDFFATVVE